MSTPEPWKAVRLLADAKRHDVSRLLFALKVVPDLPERIRRHLYEMSSVLRGEE